jgi:dimethylaniline monooxygenase (N-oxide forming)
VINVSKEMMAYSDFPPPATFSVWMHNTEMLEYIGGYAKQFGLLPYIRFHHKVQNIRRSSDYATTGRWIVEYVDAYVWISRYFESSFSDGIFHSEIFDAALLANGHHQDIFQGRIIHSHSYKNARGYEDKVVVVVGLGQSAIDSAIELSRIAKRVRFVLRIRLERTISVCIV